MRIGVPGEGWACFTGFCCTGSKMLQIKSQTGVAAAQTGSEVVCSGSLAVGRSGTGGATMLATLGTQRQVREGECVKRGPFRAGQGAEAGEEPRKQRGTPVFLGPGL